MLKDALGDRMKNYENVNRHYLICRMPVIIRIDMRAGHTFTRGMKRPFDDIFMTSMQETMKSLCENISGCVFGYTQSDEISLLLIDYQTLKTSPWFDNGVNKLTSISASMATLYFNKIFAQKMLEYKDIVYGNMLPAYIDKEVFPSPSTEDLQSAWKYLGILKKAEEKGATFDSRVFNLPKEEVTNYFLWRQNDASKNSIASVGHCYFSTKELKGKSCNQVQDMLMLQHNINWNDFPVVQKRGCACYKMQNEEKTRAKWTLDKEMPILKGANRAYVDKLFLL